MALTTNLVSYWNLQGNSNDIAGGGNNGTDTNVNYGTMFGKIAEGGQFYNGGTHSEINLGTPSNLQTAGNPPFTISCWFYNTGVPVNGVASMFSSRKSASNNGYQLWYQTSDNKLHANIQTNSGQQSVTSTATATQNAWHYAVYTLDASFNWALYLDGAASGSGTFTSGTFDGGPVFIGDGQDVGVFPWQGNLDEIGFWNRAITSAEVTQLYNGGAGLTYPFTLPNTSAMFFAAASQ